MRPAVLVLLAVLAAACSAGSDTGTPSPAPTGSPTAPSPTASASSTPTPTPPATPTPEPTPSATPDDGRVEAVWVHLFDDTLKSPASIDRMLEAVADAGFDTVVAEVVRRQDAYYDSSVLPRTTDPALAPGFDVLAYLTEQAHARGLTIQAWIPTIPAYHHVYDDLASPPGWVWTEHGPDAAEGERWVTRHPDGTWDDHLDPALPAVRDHVAAVARELAASYPIDGLHLDYVRYPDQDTGYHPAVLARWRQETGAAGQPAPDDPGWSTWRREQVTDFVTAIRRAVGEADPDLPVTAAVVAAGEGPTASRPFAATRPAERFLQDWVGWAADGLLDAVYPMNYFDASEHGDWFEQWARFETGLALQVDTSVVGGQAGYLNTPEDSLAQLRQLLDGLDGISLYSYQQTTSEPPYDRLFARLPELFTSPARPG